MHAFRPAESKCRLRLALGAGQRRRLGQGLSNASIVVRLWLGWSDVESRHPFGNNIPQVPFCVSTPHAIENGEMPGMLMIPSPFFIGSNSEVTLGGELFGARIKMWTGRQAPNARMGYWPRGSLVWNSQADADLLGCVCTAAGTPGAGRNFGLNLRFNPLVSSRK
jgi:hypothetical protein